jgi:hypothetical protein
MIHHEEHDHEGGKKKAHTGSQRRGRFQSNGNIRKATVHHEREENEAKTKVKTKS